jgi:hypothetical protein
MLALLSPLVGLATTWLENRQKKSEAKTIFETAKAEAEATVLRRKALHEGEWDLEALRGSRDSWKDEYLVIAFSIPFFMAFIEPLQPYVKAGFEILEGTPDWYKIGFSVMIAASFGLKGYARLKK